jgi:hypothetical protein
VAWTGVLIAVVTIIIAIAHMTIPIVPRARIVLKTAEVCCSSLGAVMPFPVGDGHAVRKGFGKLGTDLRSIVVGTKLHVYVSIGQTKVVIGADVTGANVRPLKASRNSVLDVSSENVGTLILSGESAILHTRRIFGPTKLDLLVVGIHDQQYARNVDAVDRRTSYVQILGSVSSMLSARIRRGLHVRLAPATRGICGWNVRTPTKRYDHPKPQEHSDRHANANTFDQR